MMNERLPLRYRQAAGKYTRFMVAMPIAVVTSWFLWERLVLGKERKQVPKVSDKKLERKEEGEG